MKTVAGATLVAALALLLYHSTLLPGLDFGDTPSFQVMAGSRVVTPRDAYPLYFAIGRLFTAASGTEPARALNLASAVEAALACGVLVLLAAELSGSLVAGIAAAGLFATSYTFWSQAVIAEVYALHILLTALTLLALLWWDRRPSTWRFIVLLAAYALSFGNHLTSIFLAPAIALFIGCRRGWRFLVAPTTLALAAVIASAGALQYAWNLHTLWLEPLPPSTFAQGLQAFWFDVTKADWRASMVANVPSALISERLHMYAFDLHQQFGWIGPALAILGALHLARTAPARAALVTTAYAVTLAFALSYNVGDTHVFLLPSHLMVALLAGAGVVSAGRAARARPDTGVAVVAAILCAITAATAFDNEPALDRSTDERPLALVKTLTSGIDERASVLLVDLNWQVDNAVNYFWRRAQHDLAIARLPEVLPHLPALVHDNAAIGRRVVAAGEAVPSRIRAAYGSGIVVDIDPEGPKPFISRAQSLAPGTRYAFAILAPSRDMSIDTADVERTLRALTGGQLSTAGNGAYIVVAGLAGQAPALIRTADRPFRTSVTLNGLPIVVRMESWLAFDTIRRMGFGHVIAGRHHALIVERGLSLVALDATGRAISTAYAANIFAPVPRFLLRTP